MTKVVTSTELQKNTRNVIDWARTRGDTVIVETYGKPMVAIMDVEEYEALLRFKRTHLRESFGEALDHVRGATQDIPPEVVNRLVDTTREAVRTEQLMQAREPA